MHPQETRETPHDGQRVERDGSYQATCKYTSAGS